MQTDYPAATAMSNAAKAPTKSKRSLPNGAKEILQDFVVAVLRGRVEQDQFLRFAVDWFTRALKEEEQRKAEQPSPGQKASRNELAESAKSATNINNKAPSKSTLEPVGSAIAPAQSRTTLPLSEEQRAGRSQTTLVVRPSSQDRPESAKSGQNLDASKSERSLTPAASRTTLDAQRDADRQPSGTEVRSVPSRVPSAAGARSGQDMSHSESTAHHEPPHPQASTLAESKSRNTLDAAPSRQHPAEPAASSVDAKSRTTLDAAGKSRTTLEAAPEPAKSKLEEGKSRSTLEEAHGPSRTTLDAAGHYGKSKSTMDVGKSRTTLEADQNKSRTTLEATDHAKEAKSANQLQPGKSSTSVNQHHAENPQEAPKDAQLESRRQAVSAESYDPAAESDVPDKVFPKSEEQLHRVKEAVKEVLLFRSLDEDHLKKVIDALEEVKVEAGEEVIKIDDEKAEHFYVIEEGEFDCFAKVNGELTKVTEYVNRGSFGELALMYNQPRAATVRARTAGKLWALDRETFKRIIVRGAYEKRKLYMSLMEKVDFLADLHDYEKQNVCDALVPRKYNLGEVVMKQGDQGDGMYFVESGEVVCTRNEDGNDQEVGRAGPGQYVGELALIAGQPRAATVTAAADGTKLAFLDSKAFERLMGPCVDILRKNVERYKDKIVAVFGENSEFLHGAA
ncbi:cAMP-dependent protein kinase type II-alpha regulatory subunit-like isoform X2 [Paramacrobiotus metropolitanus]|uniref:cAMP-dependent protein kinase type II-alpha regulatory subunit-like isoform X2 n=2 Tax=Paramacrobiotus metropolitanus TaxID=2943436 RepID=UPI002445D7E7|nr:cAMP-dependent protein kinase type II-alpha regulatory subunit-like isoform X2 [Paramacrobiotus metropolitanus]